jgi:hypothetical protein
MSILKSLKLTNVQPVRASNDPVERARLKALAAITEQRLMVEAKLAGQHFAPTHIVRRKNADGIRVAVEVPKRTRAGFFQDAGGKAFFTLRYAGKPVQLDGKNAAVEVGELTALPAILDTLAEAVRAGELDAQLAAAAAERSRILRKAK